ncbi:uncharacterized protein LY89DRAFT_733591 [Mollisia scopiformis]|uniref:Uncharacterized protein n=1 Tax=Mollisia scopiformis TaxID=149040 RepID=A0A194XC72_MOLSC|nr:uncharacterized protein LY89DRAFT_733591 [Mollisia scopiformis]KUJ17765.1 hypothetical protein LY89DRAFT_733591 [Mollisia scopiformis]
MSSWSPWAWDGSQSVYYRARKGPQNKWQYEFSQPMNTTTLRDMGPKYATLPKDNAVPIKAPSYLLQPNTPSGGTLTALCADMSVFEPEPRKMVQFARRPNVSYAQTKPVERDIRRTSLVEQKGSPAARKERRSQRREGVVRVQDWRAHLNEW